MMRKAEEWKRMGRFRMIEGLLCRIIELLIASCGYGPTGGERRKVCHLEIA